MSSTPDTGHISVADELALEHIRFNCLVINFNPSSKGR